MEYRGVLPTYQFVDGNGFGDCDALLCVAHTLSIEKALESGQEARIVQFDFNAVFDRVSHQ